MESAPHNQDSDDEKSSDSKSTVEPRRAALPASFLHGHEQIAKPPKVELPKGLFEAPKIELMPSLKDESEKPKITEETKVTPDVASSEETVLHHIQQELEKHHRQETSEDEKDEEDDSESVPPVISRSQAVPHNETFEEPKRTFESTSEPIIEGEINLRNDIEPLDLDAPVNELEAALKEYEIPAPHSESVQPLAQEADFAQWEQEQPRETHELANQLAAKPAGETPDDFAAWEEEMADQKDAQRYVAAMPSLAQAQSSPSVHSPGFNSQPAYHNTANASPLPPSNAPNRGGNLPPTPPVPPRGPGGFNPNSQPGGNGNFAPNNFANAAPGLFNTLLTPAALMLINRKMNYLDARRRVGDAAVGVIAGWALVRTAKNRHMIKRNKRETTERFKTQNNTIDRLQEQNKRLEQQVTRQEQQATYASQANANRAPQPGAEAVPTTAVAGAERATAERDERAKQARERLAQAHEQEKTQQRQLEAAPGHHIERSEWHSIEVDNKTGRVIENPASFSYGEAFNQERRQEQFQEPPQGVGQQTGQSLGHSATSGAQPSQGAPYYSQHLLQQQDKKQPDHKGLSAQQVSDQVKNPWLWIGVGFIILAFFAAAVI